jgi:hybrid polyketide synthase/nonribosomal peptide synthetase FtdB
MTTTGKDINSGVTPSATDTHYEAIAIVGMGCRFPGGANNPDQFWENLRNGTHSITETPESRWNTDAFFSSEKNKKAKMNTKWGGYIDGFDEFDPEFFGIAPREAKFMDPQQRKLLEVSWEALENGGLQPSSLSGKSVGVFVGGFTLDYKILQFTNPSFENLDAHSATGIMMTMLSNRISYIYNFNGPSMSVDTACSSSIVAVDLACKSLQQGDSELAIAGGVSLNIAPQYTISETQGGFLSPTGSSHGFAATANGYVRSEGVGVVVLKKLCAAIADGDHIHAVIKATAVNQDGKTNGITVPNGDAQFRLMKTAYAKAGVSPGKIQYLEAHGTGTPVGDPIEADSIGRILSLERAPEDLCYVGSVKTNIGHTEAAAGMAGLIKTVMAMRHRAIPPHLHLKRINPKIDLAKAPYTIPTTLVDWPQHEGPMLAAINSFGFGGTNAHLVLSEYLPVAPAARASQTPCRHDENRVKLFPVSGRGKPSLVRNAAACLQHIDALDSETDLFHLAHTAAVIRESHENRATFSYRNKAQLMEKLRRFIDSDGVSSASVDKAKMGRKGAGEQREKLAWVATGMGPQWWAMGRELYAAEPVFKQTVDAISAEFDRQADWSLTREWLLADEAQSQMDNTWLAQTANFALQVGLAALWRSHGVEPDCIVGHSTGEIAAFHLAGVYSLQDAVTVAIHRSRLQQLTHGMGKMLAVGLPVAAANAYVERHRDAVSIAAVNGPNACVISGNANTLEHIAAELQGKEVFNKFLHVEVPYHSPAMCAIKAELLQSLAIIAPRQETIPLYSTVTGKRIDGTELNADYWWRNVREPVLFAKAVQEMIDDGYTGFIEIGPHPVLGAAIEEVAQELGKHVFVTASQRRKNPEQAFFFDAMAALYSRGFDIDWQDMYRGGKFVPFPNYQWNCGRFWYETPYFNQVRVGKADHPLLGTRLAAPANSWRADISLEKYPYLNDHRIQDTCILPAAAYVEMTYGALRKGWGDANYRIHDLHIEKGIFVSADKDPAATFQFDEKHSCFQIFSMGAPDGGAGGDDGSSDASEAAASRAHPIVHATGRVSRAQDGRRRDSFDLAACQARTPRQLDREECYRRLHDHDYDYGAAFQAIQSLRAGDGELLAEVVLPALLERDGAGQYHFHPSLFDACLQTVVFSEILRLRPDELFNSRLPINIGTIDIAPGAPLRFWCHTRIVERDDEQTRADIRLYDAQLQMFGEIQGFVAKTVDSVASGLKSDTIDSWLYQPGSVESAIDPDHARAFKPCYLVLTGQARRTPGFLQALQEKNAHLCLVDATDATDAAGGAPSIAADLRSARLDVADPRALEELFAALQAQFGDVDIIFDTTDDALPSLALDRRTLERHTTTRLHGLLALAKALLKKSSDAKLWLITRNGLATAGGAPIDPLAAAVCGFGRVLAQQELSDNWGKLIDLDALADDRCVLDELACGDNEDEISYRGGVRHASRLIPAKNLKPAFPLHLEPGATYMVVGAFGAIGQLVCTMLINRGARRLIVTGRGSLPPRAQWRSLDRQHALYQRVQLVRSLEANGADVIAVDLDVCDESAISAFFDDFNSKGYPAIRGIFYSAGIVKDAMVPNLGTDEFDAVFDTKARGALALHHATAGLPLDYFVLFSSVATQVTTSGQSAYAAGNAFLDALCQARKQQGLPALSINWGPWAIGMIKELNLIEHYRQHRGMSCILPEAGMKVMERILDQPHAQLTVCDADWKKVATWYVRKPSLFAELNDATEDEGHADDAGFLDTYALLPAQARLQLVSQHLRRIVAQVLRSCIDSVDPDANLIAIGIDSLMGAELGTRINSYFGNTLSLVKLIGNASVAELARELNDKIAQDKHTLAAMARLTATPDGATVALAAVERRNRFVHIPVEEAFPLSFGQKAIWFTHQLNPASSAYNIGGVMHIPASLNLDALDKAIAGVVRRHPSLRTNFFVVDGEPVQRVFATRETTFELVDAQDMPWSQIREQVIGENRKPFDLENEALYRIRLYRQNAESYYFSISIFHIISDAWSNYMFLNEMQELYMQFNNNKEVALAPAETGYRDFVQWEGKLVNSIRGSSMYKFWRNHLPAEFPKLALPLDKKRPNVMTNQGSSFNFEIDKTLTEKITALSRKEGATMFMVLLSVYYTLLHRYSGQDDIIVGSPVAGRTTAEFSQVYGYFVNPLPLYQSFAGRPSFLSLLRKVKETTFAALENQEYPFALLVERLALAHDPSHTSVFQAMFVLLNHQVERNNIDAHSVAQYKGFPMQLLQMPEEEGQFDLTLSVYEECGVYQCCFKYNSDLFFPDTIASMSAHFLQLAQQAVSFPEKAVSEYELLSAEERHTVLQRYSNLHSLAEATVEPYTPVQVQFERQAARLPGKIAIRIRPEGEAEQSIDYQTLNAQANQLAHRLAALGVGTGSPVAVLQHKSIDLMVCVLAILKAGGAYVLLEPDLPLERLAGMVCDCETRYVLHTPVHAEKARAVVTAVTEATAAQNAAQLQLLNLSDLALGASVRDNPLAATARHDPAYVVFTSGSTGRPKGVMVTHGNIFSITGAWRSELSLDHNDIHMQMANPGFDVFSGDWLRALCHGAELDLCDKHTLLNMPLLYQTLKDNGVTVAEFIPTLLRKLMDYLEHAQCRLDFMRTLIVGSESWTHGEYRRLRKLTGAATRVVSTYGTSETTIDNCFFDFDESNKRGYQHCDASEGIPIGKPFANGFVLILDDEMKPVAKGMVGEMFIGGHGLSRGYAGNPELTDSKFTQLAILDAVLGADPSLKRVYRTGDLAKWDGNGNLLLCGRRDTQVKIRGHRIELGEVEGVLSRQEQVAQILVTVGEDAGGQKRLCAYFRRQPGASIGADQLRVHAVRSLPSFMIPDFFCEIETIPELANGKVDYKSLPRPEAVRTQKDIAEPVTWYQQEMAMIWSTMLGINRISLYDDFFDMGGNSLYLIELTLRINERFNIKIKVSDLFRLSTLLGMAGVVEDIVTGKSHGSLPYISYNQDQPRILFSFPPAGGYSIVYKTIAAAMPDTNIVSFNYLMEDDKLDRYVGMIKAIQPAGPYRLFGYSLGGNLAFEIARMLEAQGDGVDSVVIMDSYRITDSSQITPAHLDEFREQLKGHLERHTGSNEVRAHTLEQANNYIDFIYRQKNRETIQSKVHYIVEKNDADPNRVHKLNSWNGASQSGAQVYIGASDHENMLIGDHATLHAEIIQSILVGGPEASPSALAPASGLGNNTEDAVGDGDGLVNQKRAAH